MVWRLGIDLGTNSLGWAALELEKDCEAWKPVGLMDSGSRIFSDGRNPKDKQSNAAKRREPRSARKNRDRSKRRSARLMRQLVEFGLMPADMSERKKLEGGKNIPLCDSDPWILRARALNEKISPHQLGRAIFHLHQRRGFKSNRKTDSKDSESGKVYDAIKRTKEALEKKGARTLGELFGRPRLEAAKHNETAPKGKRGPQPLARVRKSGEGAKWQYEYYPTRALIIDEFDQIWQQQNQYHTDILTKEAHDHLRDTIEWQNDLKPQPVGKCTLIPEEERAPKALPSSQRTRIFQEVNALRYGPAGQAQGPLTLEQRNLIVDRLLNPTKFQHPSTKTGKLIFNKMRSILDLSDYDKFNTESKKRDHLMGDETAARLIQKDRWGPDWFDLDLATQDEIVDRLINEEEEDKLVVWLCTTHGLERNQALRVADCPLVAGHGNLSKMALDRILPHLEAGLIYSDAATIEFGDHRPMGTGEIHDKKLPYYGEILERSVAFGTGDPKHSDEKRYGKIANPTVHVALNQVQKVVNDLMKRFGAPEQIVLELARDLPLSAEGKKELEKTQRDNQDANDKRRKQLAEEFGQPDNYDNRMRLRLYEELEALGKRCVYTGEQIGGHNLFSSEVEIEHILPFSRTFDDGFSNKTLSMRRANRNKGNKTPFEAFGDSMNGYDWEQISLRAAELSPAKRWRFAPDAMERFENFEGGFLARQLTDTQYISRLAKGYLEAIYGGQGHAGAKNHVWVINGRLTADLRHIWGLNSVLRGHNEPESEAQKKNRNDHRHHAIDAIVIACTDRGILKRASDQAKKNDADWRNEIVAKDSLMGGTPPPWGKEGSQFRADVENSVRNIIVSHKPDHGIQGAIFQDSAMSMIAENEEEKTKGQAPLMRKYVPIDSIVRKNLDPSNKKSWTIVDPNIRLALSTLAEGKSDNELSSVIHDWSSRQTPNIGRLRLYKRENALPVTVQTGDETPFKYYNSGGNYCYDIWTNEKGKWTGEVISTFDAYQLDRKHAKGGKKWWQSSVGRSGQKLVMRLRKNDLLQIEHDGRILLVSVYKFTEGTINMAVHFEADVSARVADKSLPAIAKSPGSLQISNAKRVTVSPSGVVKIYQ